MLNVTVTDISFTVQRKSLEGYSLCYSTELSICPPLLFQQSVVGVSCCSTVSSSLCKVPRGDSHCDLVLEEDNATIIDLKFDWEAE